MGHRAGLIGVWAALGAPALAGPTLQITSYSYALHPATHTASFELVFNRVPDFLHADPVGRQADSFWFDMDTDMDLGTGLPASWYQPPLGVDRRVSAYEIWTTGALVVHDQAYGPALGTLPYSLTGTTVRFDADYALLAIPLAAPGLYYAINVAEFGATTQQIMVVPLPPAAGAGLAGLVALGACRVWSRRGLSARG